MKKVVAFFDFDGTLTKSDSLSRFLWYYYRSTPQIFIRKLLFLAPTLLKYCVGLSGRNIAKEKLFTVFFAHVDNKEFMAKAQSFSHSILPSLLKAEAMERLQWHQQQGHQCILVSASIEGYLIPWAERVGFSKVLATRLEVDSAGLLTGKFFGKNCYGPEKARRLEEYLCRLNRFEIYAYGDSRGDKELLAIADLPFYKTFTEERAYPGE